MMFLVIGVVDKVHPYMTSYDEKNVRPWDQRNPVEEKFLETGAQK